jgi:hypothetical protein
MRATGLRIGRMAIVATASLGLVWTLGLATSAAAKTPASKPHHAATTYGASTHVKKTHLKKTMVRDGYKCTVVSSAHKHSLVGHAGDVVCAIGGNNTLTAVGPGHVVLIGGKGKDRLVASSSPNSFDTLIGGRGADAMIGGSTGTDIIQTGTGGDSIDCGTGTAHVTVVGSDSGDTESSDCQSSSVENVSQYWHGTVVGLASDGSTVTVSVSDSSDGAQAWLQAQSPACDLTNLIFDLTTNPASVQIDGGGSLGVGDDVEIASIAGTTNCVPVAVSVEGQPSNNETEGGNVSQHWQGSVVALATDGSTMTVSVSDSSDGAQAWLQAQSPACDPTNLVFDLKSAPANIQVDGAGSLAAGDNVEIQATAGTTNCVPVAVEVHAGAADSTDGGGGAGGDGGDGGLFGTVASVNGSTAAGSCGAAGTDGSFTLTSPWSSPTTTTVDVSGTNTTFVEPGVTSPSFAGVCVGGQAGAIGTISSGTVTASWVFVAPSGGNGND